MSGRVIGLGIKNATGMRSQVKDVIEVGLLFVRNSLAKFSPD